MRTTQRWEPQVFRALCRASCEVKRNTTWRIREYDTAMRVTSKMTMTMGTEKPYQILMVMSAQAKRATPVCSQ